MNTTKAIIGLLVAAVVVVAILMYVPFEAPTPSDTGTGANTSGTSGDLTADEERVLMPPGESASAEEQEAYAALLWGLAKETTNVSIGASCKATPVVVNVPEGATLSVRNTDAIAHTLVFDAEHSLAVAPGETEEIDLSFWSAGRLHPYLCDGGSNSVGIVIVSE